MKTYTWRGAMLIIAGIVLNCILFGAMFRPVKPQKKKTPDLELQTCITPSQNYHRNIKWYIFIYCLIGAANNNSSDPRKLRDASRLAGASEQDPMIRSHSFTKKSDKHQSGEVANNKNCRQNTMRSTVSQPFLNGHHDDHGHSHRHHHHHHHHGSTSSGMSRTMSRPDILYQVPNLDHNLIIHSMIIYNLFVYLLFYIGILTQYSAISITWRIEHWRKYVWFYKKFRWWIRKIVFIEKDSELLL